MAWTLVQSYQFQNNTSFNRLRFGLDKPFNEKKPRWDVYRLSKSRMQSIQDDSSQFRITCKYDTDGMVYRDYLQATKTQVDIMSFDYASQPCSVVDVIDIRGHSCSKCEILLVQTNVYGIHSSIGCSFKPSGYFDCGGLGEDNFGWYDCANPAHRCSSSPTATTQIWLGGGP
ncbi:uncharacterized protein LOC114540231 [Dendronephthya gigantea]|uniref:uncharacterized protein LOC114540231 n=1 Tax=Dendronephthya gigantea TaxID=151771 RepID=UPI00106D3397|nr:uncharacterized protein LOC114540231 [Dendronephthya gigantea]